MASSSAADHHPSPSSHSPRSAARTSRHPWSHIVRGGAAPANPDEAPSSPTPPPAAIPPTEPANRAAVDDDAAAHPPPQPSDGQDQGSSKANGHVALGKKVAAAWKRPSNGSIEAGPVMGAATWPALSETTKASPKSSSSDTLKPLADAAVSAPPTEPLIPNPSLEADSSNFIPSSTKNHAAPVRQKSMKRGGGGAGGSGASANGGVAQPAILDKQAAPELSPRDRSTRNPSNWGGRSGPHHDHGSSSDHHRGYGSNHRRGNNGGGPHHGNYGGRRDQDRGGYDGYHRGVGGRESHIQQRGARSYFRPPSPVTPPFISHVPPVQPFANQVVYPDLPSPVIYVAHQPPPESFRPLTFVPHPAAPPAVFFPAIDPQRAMLLKQIDYYFSSENLCKDIYLRQNMDEQGWVPISLIAGFNRVKSFTDSIHYILDTVRLSTVVEVQGENIRRRFDWMNWVLHPSNSQFVSISGQQSPGALEFDNLADRLQTIGVGGSNNQNAMRVSNQGEVAISRSASGYLNKQLQVLGDVNGEGNGQVTRHTNSDGSIYGTTLVRSDTL